LNSGQNYWDHRDEKPPVEQHDPEFFLKAPLGVVGPGEPVILDPAVTRKLDYEVELAVIIGKPGRHIPTERALEHVFGYTVANDVTARDRQAVPHPEGGWEYRLGPGKNFDTCAPLGPWIVTRDDVPDPQELGLRTYVNGELRQSNSTAKMIWNVATIVSFFSDFYTLQPGVLIETGTPGGTAWATDPDLGGRPYERGDVKRGGYLQPGDVVTVEVDGIGTLTNPIVAARAPEPAAAAAAEAITTGG
jgi:2-keto-4-pentenoate hydratase/2-oxohepta-3-ene-1,7-dioic acid hydratase in catechol pathway